MRDAEVIPIRAETRMSGVRQDGYVIGFTIFTAGGVGHWKNYDINPILPELMGYVGSQR